MLEKDRLVPEINIFNNKDFLRNNEKASEIRGSIYLPPAVLTTEEIAGWGVELPNGKLLKGENIREKIGVERRHIAGPKESVLYMAARAAEMAIGNDRDVSMVMVSTSHPTPYNVSKEISTQLGIKNPGIMDVHAACSGSARMFAYIREHQDELWGKRVLLVASEKFSNSIVDLRRPDALQLDPSLGQTILGDGAAAMSFVVGEELKVLSSVNKDIEHPEGKIDIIKLGVGGNRFVKPYIEHRVACSERTSEFLDGYFTQDGQAVYKRVQLGVPDVINEAISLSGLTSNEIDFVVAHSGSKTMVDALRGRLKGYNLYSEYEEGNMSSVSMLYSCVDALNKGFIGKGSKIVLAGFGAGSPHLFSSTAVVEINK